MSDVSIYVSWLIRARFRYELERTERTQRRIGNNAQSYASAAARPLYFSILLTRAFDSGGKMMYTVFVVKTGAPVGEPVFV
jgi:hypothetical protein